jgi:hypothetical protein
MDIMEIRTGLRRIDFTARTDGESGQPATAVLVEFEVPARLAGDQRVMINLGVRDGVRRELQGRPRIVTPATGSRSSSFLYRLEGDLA